MPSQPWQQTVRTTATLQAELSSVQESQNKLSAAEAVQGQDGRHASVQHKEWHEQQREQQKTEPEGGASTSQKQDFNRLRSVGRVTFAAHSRRGSNAAADHDAASEETTAADGSQGPQHLQFPASTGSAATSASNTPREGGLINRFLRKTLTRGPSMADSLVAKQMQRVSTGLGQSHSQADRLVAEPSTPGRPLRSSASMKHPGASSTAVSTLSTSLKGLLGEASAKILGSIIGLSPAIDDIPAEEQQEDLWFTGLDDFKPICHMLHRGRYMTAYFACANKTGQHFLLKKYDKHKMVPAEERGVRRSIAFSELLRHPNLVRCVGQWEETDIIYVVEEYVGKGDIFNDCISHPEKYTERHVAVALVKPLLKALVYLHENNIIHRCVLPENVYMGIDDILRLGHLTLAVDQLSDRPKSRTTLLDYMAPEMMSVKAHNEHELALVIDDSDEEGGSAYEQQQQQRRGWQQQPRQQEWPFLQQQGQQVQQQGQVAKEQLGLLGMVPANNSSNSSSSMQQQKLERQDSGSISDGTQEQQQQSSKAAAASAAGGPAVKQRVHQPAQLLTSPLASPDSCEPAAHARRGALSPSALWPKSAQRAKSAQGIIAATVGKAEWEYLDYYDEKVDIWQIGCLMHELLCGSMPFEVESKVGSAGLALWADIEQPPGTFPPDCVSFMQQALTKDPKQRPSAEQLLQHPWLARCEAGEPWRDPMELAAAKAAAERATVLGWLRHASSAMVASCGALTWQVLHGSRVQPLTATSQQQQQLGLDSSGVARGASAAGSSAGPESPTKQGAGNTVVPFSSTKVPDAAGLQQQCQQQHPQHQQPQQQAGQILQQAISTSNSRSSPAIAGLTPLKLTKELMGAFNASWTAADPAAAAAAISDASSIAASAPTEHDLGDADDVAAACVVTCSSPLPLAAGIGATAGVMRTNSKAGVLGGGRLLQQPQQAVLLPGC